jgi:hypothetical protein
MRRTTRGPLCVRLALHERVFGTVETLRMNWGGGAAATAVWADTRLDRTGRCHETEISLAFRTDPGNGRYRTQDGISDSKIRNMIANW